MPESNIESEDDGSDDSSLYFEFDSDSDKGEAESSTTKSTSKQ